MATHPETVSVPAGDQRGCELTGPLELPQAETPAAPASGGSVGRTSGAATPSAPDWLPHLARLKVPPGYVFAVDSDHWIPRP